MLKGHLLCSGPSSRKLLPNSQAWSANIARVQYHPSAHQIESFLRIFSITNMVLRVQLTYQPFHFREVFMSYCPGSHFSFCPITRIDFCVISWKNDGFFRICNYVLNEHEDEGRFGPYRIPSESMPCHSYFASFVNHHWVSLLYLINGLNHRINKYDGDWVNGCQALRSWPFSFRLKVTNSTNTLTCVNSAKHE